MKAVKLTALLVPLAMANLAGFQVQSWANEKSYNPDSVVGIWETAHEDSEWSHIEIFKKEDLYYGKIVWLSEPEYPPDDPEGMAGKPKVDRKNPDESLRDQSILDLEILYDFKYEKEHKWKDGRIYDPKSGKTYRCKMEIKEDGLLHVRGYVKVGFVKLGRTTEWTRVPIEASSEATSETPNETTSRSQSEPTE